MLTEAQEKLRNLGLGGSDAAAACGLDRFKSRLRLYLEKTGDFQRGEMTEPQLWGHILEAPIRDRFAHVKGWHIDLPTNTFFHPRHSFMLAHPDGLIDTDAIYEGKTARFDEDWGEPGSDQIPTGYMCQVQHTLAVTQRNVAHVAVLIAGSDFRMYEVEADTVLQEELIDNEHAFWQLVLKHEPPEPEETEWQNPELRRLLARLYHLSTGELKLAGQEEEHFYQTYQMAREKAKSYEEVAEGAMNHLVWAMENASMLQFDDGKRLRRKLVKTREFVRAASEHWDYRVVKSEPETTNG